MSILVCDKVGKFGKVCGNDRFVEDFATQIIPPPEGQGKNDSGKRTQLSGTGRYYYRCVQCGKVHSFFKLTDDDDLDYRPSEL